MSDNVTLLNILKMKPYLRVVAKERRKKYSSYTEMRKSIQKDIANWRQRCG